MATAFTARRGRPATAAWGGALITALAVTALGIAHRTNGGRAAEARSSETTLAAPPGVPSTTTPAFEPMAHVFVMTPLASASGPDAHAKPTPSAGIGRRKTK